MLWSEAAAGRLRFDFISVLTLFFQSIVSTALFFATKQRALDAAGDQEEEEEEDDDDDDDDFDRELNSDEEDRESFQDEQE